VDGVDETTTIYEVIGGEEGVRTLVDRFYDLMDTLPEASEIRAMHPADLTESRQKLFEFLSGWFGGPGLYMERRGHPRLRMRHLPFPVDDAAAHQWMLCMRGALDGFDLDPVLRERLDAAFANTASHMRNR